MANAQFQLGPGLLSANNVLNNLQQVNERIEDCQELLRQMHRDFSSAEDLAQELGYPDTIDKSIDKLEGLQADRRDLEDRCASLREGLRTRLDRIKQLSSAKPDELSSFLESIDPRVQVFLVRLIPRVFNDRQSMLDISPQYKELILEDLKYLGGRQGPSLTQEQASGEEISRLKAEIAVLKNDKKSLTTDKMGMRGTIQRLDKKYQDAVAQSERRKQDRITSVAEVKRLVHEKKGLNSAKIQAQKDLVDAKRHYRSLQATSEGLQAEKDRLSAELQGSEDASRKKDAEIESLNNRIKQLVGGDGTGGTGGTGGTSKSVRELQNECKALQAQKDKARDELRRQEQKFASDKEAARARHRQEADELEKRAGDLDQQVRDARGRAEELQEQVGVLRRAAERAEDKRAGVSNQLKKLRLECGSHEDTITRLEEERDALQCDKDEAESRAAGLQGRVDRMQERVDEMKKRQEEMTRAEQQLVSRIEQGEASTGAEVTSLKSRATDLETELSLLRFQHDSAADSLRSAEEREKKLSASLDRLADAHKGCGRAQSSLRDELTEAKIKLSDAIVEKDGLEGTAQDLRETVSSLEKSIATERAEVTGLQADKKTMQHDVVELTERLDKAEDEARELGETRDRLDAEVAGQNDRNKSLTEQLAAAALEQQRLQESLDREKGAHAGTAARENTLMRQLSEREQRAREACGALQERLTEATTSLEARRSDVDALSTAMGNLQVEADLARARISALEADLSAETASARDMTKRLSDGAEGIQQFLVRACRVAAGSSSSSSSSTQALGGLVLELQQPAYVAATGEGHVQWEILDSWTDELSSDHGEAARAPPTVELLALELFGAAHAGRLGSGGCQAAMREMSGLLLSADKIHAGVLTQLARAIVQEVTSRAGVSLEIGAAFWQIMTIVEQRWRSPHQAAWRELRQALEDALGSHRYREAFAVIAAKAELQEGEMCHFYDETRAVLCQPAWADAVLFNTSDRSARFFSKTRFTLGCMDATIEPAGGHGVVTLPVESDRDMEWALDWMEGSE